MHTLHALPGNGYGGGRVEVNLIFSPPACRLNIPMICAWLNRLFFIQNLLRYYAEKTLRVNTTNFRGEYPTI